PPQRLGDVHRDELLVLHHHHRVHRASMRCSRSSAPAPPPEPSVPAFCARFGAPPAAAPRRRSENLSSTRLPPWPDTSTLAASWRANARISVQPRPPLRALSGMPTPSSCTTICTSPGAVRRHTTSTLPCLPPGNACLKTFITSSCTIIAQGTARSARSAT